MVKFIPQFAGKDECILARDVLLLAGRDSNYKDQLWESAWHRVAITLTSTCNRLVRTGCCIFLPAFWCCGAAHSNVSWEKSWKKEEKARKLRQNIARNCFVNPKFNFSLFPRWSQYIYDSGTLWLPLIFLPNEIKMECYNTEWNVSFHIEWFIMSVSL